MKEFSPRLPGWIQTALRMTISVHLRVTTMLSLTREFHVIRLAIVEITISRPPNLIETAQRPSSQWSFDGLSTTSYVNWHPQHTIFSTYSTIPIEISLQVVLLYLAWKPPHKRSCSLFPSSRPPLRLLLTHPPLSNWLSIHLEVQCCTSIFLTDDVAS
jgi:hypothetical protein